VSPEIVTRLALLLALFLLLSNLHANVALERELLCSNFDASP
jgi:hypothetical protein